MFLSLEGISEFFRLIIMPFIISIIAVVIGELAGYELLKRREKPKIIIDTVYKFGKLGFSVKVEKRMIKDARIRCNNISYDWKTLIDENHESSVDRKDLFVGDSPSTFFPYKVSIKHAENLDSWETERNEKTTVTKVTKRDGISLTVEEVTTQENVVSIAFVLPRDVTAFFQSRLPLQFDVSIRIIGEGVEEIKDYKLNVRLRYLGVPSIIEGKPLMDKVQCEFELGK